MEGRSRPRPRRVQTSLAAGPPPRRDYCQRLAAGHRGRHSHREGREARNAAAGAASRRRGGGGGGEESVERRRRHLGNGNGRSLMMYLGAK
uniref:Uncharacterized protein n=1 Tax=Oryza meridionalis TaxID=40149 RepID=A0A0E0FDE7_9ORYZ